MVWDQWHLRQSPAWLLVQSEEVAYAIRATTASNDAVPSNNEARPAALGVCIADSLYMSFVANVKPAQGLPDASAVYPYTTGPLSEVRDSQDLAAPAPDFLARLLTFIHPCAPPTDPPHAAGGERWSIDVCREWRRPGSPQRE